MRGEAISSFPYEDDLNYERTSTEVLSTKRMMTCAPYGILLVRDDILDDDQVKPSHVMPTDGRGGLVVC